MANIDLDALSLFELKALQMDVIKAIAEFDNRKRMEALLALETHAKELGFSLAELTGRKRTRKASGPVGAKYRHPENPDVTWSGRGSMPGWFKDALAAGTKPQTLAV